MSKIIYKPHCGQCGALIEQKIQIKRATLEVGDHVPILYRSPYYKFDPYRCDVCGATFDSAEFQPPKEVEDF